MSTTTINLAREERRREFYEEADARMAKIESTGETIAWSELRTYLEDRAAGKPAIRPKPSSKRS